MFDDLPPERPRPRKRPQQDRSRITVEAVLEAAAQVLEADGYDGLTTNRVAERAGVSIGTLYQYFPDKAAVVAGLVEARLGAEVEAVRAAFAEAERLPLAEASDHLVGAFVGLFEGAPERSAVVFYGALRVRWRPVMDDLLGQMTGAVAGLLERRRAEADVEDPALAAYVVVHAVVGAVVRALAERPGLVASGAVGREARRLARRYLSAAPPRRGGAV